MDNVSKENLADRNIWVRIVYMIILVIAYAVAETLLTLVAIFQFLCALVTGEINTALHRFGANLSTYIYQILQFATFNSEELPFPFTEWPDTEPSDSPWSEKAEQASQTPSADASANTQDAELRVGNDPDQGQEQEQDQGQDQDQDQDQDKPTQ